MYNITYSIVLYQKKTSTITPLILSISNCASVEKLYLVDNSPTNALQTITTPTKVKYIFNNANLGYGAGHKIAVKQALIQSRYHLVLNPDITFENGTVDLVYYQQIQFEQPVYS